MLIGLMVAALAQRTDDRSVGIPAALIFWFHPGTLIAEARGASRSCSSFSLMLFMFSLYRALDRATTLDYLIAGLTLGCVVLVKYTAAISGGAVRLSHFQGKERTRATPGDPTHRSYGSRSGTDPPAPWTARNYELTKESSSQPRPFKGSRRRRDNTSVAQFCHLSGEAFKASIWKEHDVRNKLSNDLGLRFQKPDTTQLFYDVKDRSDVQRYADEACHLRITAKNLLCSPNVSL